MTATGKQNTESRKVRRVRQGIVISDARDKTIKIQCSYWQKHPKYGKIIRRRTALHVHDPSNDAKLGDLVEVMACRPISKQKSWRLVRVIQSAAGKD